MDTHHKLSDLIQYYLDYVDARGLRNSTIALYRMDLKLLEEYCPYLEKFDRFTVQKIFSDKRAQGVRGVSIHRYYRCFKTFAKWLYEEDITDRNLLDRLRPPLVDHSQKEAPSDEVIEALLKTCKYNLIGMRNRAILMILLDSGMRVGELVKLTRADIKPEGILLKDTKGRRDRYAFITDTTKRRLTRYLEKRTDNDPALFLTQYGKPINRDSIQQMMKLKSKQIGHTIAPHALRRYAATTWAEGGGNLEVIRQLLGHSKLTTTQMYIGIRPSILKEFHSGLSVMNKLNKKR